MQQSGEREFLFYEKKFKHSPSQFLSLRSLDSTELNFVYPGGISYMCRQNRFSVWSHSACEVGEVCSVTSCMVFHRVEIARYKAARQARRELGGGAGAGGDGGARRSGSSKKVKRFPS